MWISRPPSSSRGLGNLELLSGSGEWAVTSAHGFFTSRRKPFIHRVLRAPAGEAHRAGLASRPPVSLG
jgi:hypothetical protein